MTFGTTPSGDPVLENGGGGAGPSPCPCCGTVDQGLLFQSVEPDFAVITCARCGLGRTWPPVPDEAIGSWYPPSYYGDQNVRFNPLFERLTRWFRRRRGRVVRKLERPGKALDVGCGRGFLLANLRDHGFDPLGLEVSDVAAWHARHVLGLPVRIARVEDLDLEDSSFNVVIFWHSLEHLTNPLAAIDRARRMLRPGGLLVIAVPNFESWEARAFGRHWFHLDIPRHYFHFGVRSLGSALRERGFFVRKVDHFSLEQNPYGILQSSLNLFGFEHNLLYMLLKRESARAKKLRQFPIQIIATCFLAALLLPASLLAMLIETAFRSGGTIEVYATRDGE
ncbi:MAG: class I SAM-dependent methyltransferase [Acidobacteriota bacterium]